MIKPCDCKSAYQDEQYGRQNRVHNPTVKDGKLVGYRCTVCTKTKSASS